MNSTVRNIVFIGIFVLLCIVVYQLIIPYIGELKDETIVKRIDIEAGSDVANPVQILVGTSTILTLELAISEFERSTGLGGRFFLEEDEAMLFVFENDSNHGIWMKNMLFPLDIAWLDRSFKVVHTIENVSPSTYPETFYSDIPSRYVLEANAGYFKQHSIAPGTTFKLVDDKLSL